MNQKAKADAEAASTNRAEADATALRGKLDAAAHSW